jgi:hypothetical protein
MIYFLIFGFAVIGFMAYLGIKGTNEIIDYHNSIDYEPLPKSYIDNLDDSIKREEG